MIYLIAICYNICYGCIKETSPRDVSFTRPKLLFVRRKKLIIIILGGGGGGGGGGVIYFYVYLPIFRTTDNLK